MKKTMITLSLVGMSFLTLASGKENTAKAQGTDLREAVINLIGNPGFESNESVSIRFFVSESNHLRIQNIKGASDEAKLYVAEKLHQASIEAENSEINKLYNLTIVFRNQ